MANEKIPRTFLTFWKFNKRKWDWHCFSKNHFINSAYVLLFQFYEYHPVWNSFSNDNPFPSSVFLSFWATCPPTTLTSTEIEIFRWISDFYRDWRKIPSFPRDAEMSHRIWQEETRCDEDGHCVSRDTAGNTSWWQLILGAWSYTELLRLRRPWLCCYNNYHYADTGAGNITLLCNT